MFFYIDYMVIEWCGLVEVEGENVWMGLVVNDQQVFKFGSDQEECVFVFVFEQGVGGDGGVYFNCRYGCFGSQVVYVFICGVCVIGVF